MEVTAEQAGFLQQILKKEGDTVAVGDILGLLASGQAGTAENAPAQPIPTVVSLTLVPAQVPDPGLGESSGNRDAGQLSSSPEGPVNREIEGIRPPTPLASRLAAEHQVDLSRVKSSEPQGRVTREDVINYLEKSNLPPTAAAPTPPPG